MQRYLLSYIDMDTWDSICYAKTHMTHIDPVFLSMSGDVFV